MISFYLYIGNSYTGKTAFLYWDELLDAISKMQIDSCFTGSSDRMLMSSDEYHGTLLMISQYWFT